ncbi:hypothetical protein LTR64_003682 [Lithohypha guttulata]|uniref:uncharacterized protein n=1 Tax=Lithohypha guttulata TaxID=1690604 RepID=UPI00315CAD4F
MASSSEISPRSTHPSHLHSSLVNFVVANRTAVTSMMNPPKADLKTFETYFLDLPAEIRCMVYKYVFDWAILKLHYHLQHTHIERGKLRLQPVSIDDIITHISDYKGALLRVSAFCKQEALYMLASCTTIVFEHQDNQREDLLHPIDHDFLRHVRGVQMFPDAFIHTDRKLLPNLKEVVLSYNVGGPCGRISIRAWFHSLTCSTCVDPTGFMSYEKIKYEL